LSKNKRGILWKRYNFCKKFENG